MTGGIYLSQLADLTGVASATLQNWVKRGFVSSPVDRKYSMRQTARMILIAILRKSLPMDDIVDLLSSLNHNLSDESDDLIDDSQLYLYFCDLVIQMPAQSYFEPAHLSRSIAAAIADFSLEKANSADRLERVLRIMLQAYAASQLQDQVRRDLQKLKKEGGLCD